MKVTEKNCVLKTTVIGTEENTFEIIRELEGEDEKREEVFVIQVFPTISINDVETYDSTTMHLLNRMRELGWRKVHMLNLFSKVTKGKMLVSGLKSVDKENLSYIRNVLKAKGNGNKVIICWGNSLVSNSIANQTKKEILEMYSNMYPGECLYHIVAKNMFEDLKGTHILYLGLRYSDEPWIVEEYPIHADLERLKGIIKEKNDKKGEKKENVLKNHESSGLGTNAKHDLSGNHK